MISDKAAHVFGIREKVMAQSNVDKVAYKIECQAERIDHIANAFRVLQLEALANDLADIGTKLDQVIADLRKEKE